MRKLETVKQQTIPFDQFEPYTHMQNQDSEMVRPKFADHQDLLQI